MNKQGLARDIPEPVKRTVRQRCGFGCVVCGLAIYRYDHFDPPFADATVHDPDGIRLLCGACDDRQIRGHLSEESLRKATQEPITFARGYARSAFDIGSNRPTLVFGGTRFEGMEVPLQIEDIPVLQLRPAESPGAPYQLSGVFADSSGIELFRIVENEWRGEVASWDIEVVGPRITVRRGPRDITLMLEVTPPNILNVLQIDMYLRGCRVVGREGRAFKMISSDGSSFTYSELGSIGAPPEGVGVLMSDGGMKIGVARRPGAAQPSLPPDGRLRRPHGEA